MVKHDKICSGVIKDVPTESGRFLGDISGMAEYLNGSVIFCRHKSCWRLDVARNSWSKVNELHIENHLSIVNICQHSSFYWKSCLAEEICSRILQKFQSEFQSDKQPAMPTY